MRRQESGFTLIELVIVLVILGILAAVAVPQFYNATADAQTAAVGGIRAAAASGIATYTARNKVPPTVTNLQTELSATGCSSGILQVASSAATGQGVRVVLIKEAGGNAAACTDTVVGVSTANFVASLS